MYLKKLEYIVDDIVNQCHYGEYICDTTLIADYGIDCESELGLLIEDEVNKRLTKLYNKTEIYHQNYRENYNGS